MTIFPTLSQPIQADEALRLLSELYARRFASGPPPASRPLASTQRVALEHLNDLAVQVEPDYASIPEEAQAWRTAVEKAINLVDQVIQANGSAQVLLAGETDGFRHLCRRCCQSEANFQRVRYFDYAARRPLLKAEVSNSARAVYGKCQVCQQVLVPTKCVVLVPGGTSKHLDNCSCRDCNRAHIASLAFLYECDEVSHAFRLPAVATIAAPSAQQAKQRALKACWESGWYLLCSQ